MKLLKNWIAEVNGEYVSINSEIIDLMTDENLNLFDNQETLEFHLAEQVADNLNASDFGSEQ